MTPSSLHHLLLSDDYNHPIAFNAKEIKTLGELKAQVRRVIHFLAEKPNTHYLLAFNDPWYFTVALLAVQQIGSVPVFPENMQPDTLRMLSKNMRLLTDISFDNDALVISRSMMTSVSPSSSIQFRLVDSDRSFIELRTSGSTGDAKTVVKPLRCFEAEVATLEATFTQMNDVDLVRATVSHSHIYGFLFCIIWPLISGRMFDCRVYRELPDSLVNSEGTSSYKEAWVTSPAFWKQWSKERRTNDEEPKVIFCSGGPLSQDLALCVEANLKQLPVEVFGSTETGGIAWRQQSSVRSAWQVFDGITYSCTNKRLSISSPFTPIEGEFMCDDYVEALSDRQFHLLGRVDRIVKIAEKRVSLNRIEQITELMAGIEQCVALVLPVNGRDFVHLVVTHREDFSMHYTSPQHLWRCVRSALNQHIDSVALPRRIMAVEQLPLNSQGKVQTKELMEFFK